MLKLKSCYYLYDTFKIEIHKPSTILANYTRHTRELGLLLASLEDTNNGLTAIALQNSKN